MLYVVFTHHKTGTVVCLNSLCVIAKKLKVPFKQITSWHESLPNEGIIFYDHSKYVNFTQLKTKKFKGIHLVRHPFQIIVSGCDYHKRSSESWLHIPQSRFNGLSYQQKLNSLSLPHDDLEFEMVHVGHDTIMEIYNFPSLPQIKRITYENMMTSFDHTWGQIFEWFGWSTDQLLPLVQQFDLRRNPSLVQRDHVTNKEIILDSYKKRFSPQLVKKFNNTFPPDLWKRLPYSPSNVV